jgi:hypothetical protein
MVWIVLDMVATYLIPLLARLIARFWPYLSLSFSRTYAVFLIYSLMDMVATS